MKTTLKICITTFFCIVCLLPTFLKTAQIERVSDEKLYESYAVSDEITHIC